MLYNILYPTELLLIAVAMIPFIDVVLTIINKNTAKISRKITLLDLKTNLFNICHLVYLYIIILLFYRVITNNIIKNTTKIIIIICLIIFLYINIFSTMNIWNIFLSLLCDNTPMNIDKNNFPNHINFEKKENFKIIQQEIYDIINNYEMLCADTEIPTIATITIKKNNNCWRWKFLKLNGKLDNNLLQNSPLLQSLLSDELIYNVSISMLDPEISIPPHKGYFKGFLRYHICIETPDDDPDKPYIIVGGEKYIWKTGEGILFDDMFEHEVVNRSKKRRIVLFLDIKRINLSKPIIKINDYLLKNISENKLINMFIKKQHEQVKIN